MASDRNNIWNFNVLTKKKKMKWHLIYCSTHIDFPSFFFSFARIFRLACDMLNGASYLNGMEMKCTIGTAINQLDTI